MTKARDTAEVTNVTIGANATGDVLAVAFNINNSSADRVAVVNIPGGATPTGVSFTGSMAVKTMTGTSGTVTDVQLDTKSGPGVALVKFVATIFSSDEVYKVEATSSDASFTITY